MSLPRPLIASFLIASSLALGVPLSVHAHPGTAGPGHEGGLPGMHGERGMPGATEMPRFLRGLDLTEAQRDKIFDLLHAQAPALRDKAKEIRKAHIELRGLTFSGQYDEDKARALTERGARAMSEMALMRARIDHSIYQLLSAEQRKQLEERKSRWETRGRGPERPEPRRS